MMAAGKRPVPFRTRKLSPPAPMVLPPGGSGRVGYRRPNNFTHSTRHTNPHGLCGGCLSSYAYPYCWLRGAYTGVRIADNTTRTHHRSGPNTRCLAVSALRTTRHTPMIGAHPRMPELFETPRCGQPDAPTIGPHPRTPAHGQTPHCGQPRSHKQWVCANEPDGWEAGVS